MGSLLVCTAACAGMEPIEGTGTSSSASMTQEEIDATEPTEEESDLGYGWETEVRDKSIGKFTLSELVTDPKVKVREDGRSCVGCHSWAEYQDRESFCDRVDAFLEMPTAKGDGKDSPSAKPANLKKLLKNWKAAKCPN